MKTLTITIHDDNCGLYYARRIKVPEYSPEVEKIRELAEALICAESFENCAQIRSQVPDFQSLLCEKALPH